MGIGVAIFLIAVGAILAFAVNFSTGGVVDLHAVGWILIVVGVLGMVLSMLFWSSWGGPGYFSRRRTTAVGGPAGTSQETIDEGRI